MPISNSDGCADSEASPSPPAQHSGALAQPKIEDIGEDGEQRRTVIGVHYRDAARDSARILLSGAAQFGASISVVKTQPRRAIRPVKR